jgi:RimJ/RimL family protein N-acetyltransferase
VRSIDQSKDAIIFGLFLLKTGKHIGNLKISGLVANLPSGEIGYLIGDREVWGKGYATEAIVALSDFAFSELGLTELTAGAYSENQGSIRVLEKCGFEKTETTTIAGDPLASSKAQQIYRFTLCKSN